MAAEVKQKKHIAWKVITLLCVTVCAACAFWIADIMKEYHDIDTGFEQVRESSNNGRDIRALQEQNADTVGWVNVADTNIDYPVMDTPNDTEYYLRRNFNKEYSYGGTPFCAAGCRVPNGKVTLIMGHNMNNGSMFHDVLKFENSEFFNSHTISFTTIAGEGTYKPIAVFRINVNSESAFRYWRYTGNISEAQYFEFVSVALSNSSVSADVNIDYSKQLLALSTCSYGAANERCVVLAQRVDM